MLTAAINHTQDTSKQHNLGQLITNGCLAVGYRVCILYDRLPDSILEHTAKSHV